MIGAITISIGYGITIQSTNDPYIEIAEEALKGIAAAASPGTFLVESFPFLKYVPSFLPGAGFKRKAKVWRQWTQKMVHVPFLAAQRLIVRGRFLECGCNPANMFIGGRQRHPVICINVFRFS